MFLFIHPRHPCGSGSSSSRILSLLDATRAATVTLLVVLLLCCDRISAFVPPIVFVVVVPGKNIAAPAAAAAAVVRKGHHNSLVPMTMAMTTEQEEGLQPKTPEKYVSAGIVPGTDMAIQTAFHLHQRGAITGWQFLMDSGSGWVATFRIDEDSPEAASAGVSEFFEQIGHEGGNILSWTTSDSAAEDDNNDDEQKKEAVSITTLLMHQEITRTVGHSLLNAIYPFQGMSVPRPKMLSKSRVASRNAPSYVVYEIPAVPALITLLRNQICWAAAKAAAASAGSDNIDFALIVTPVPGRNTTANILISTPYVSDGCRATENFLAAVDEIILSNSGSTEHEAAQRKLIV